MVPPLKDVYRTTPIFRNPDTLVTEMKNLSCSRLVAMLHLGIQKRKEAMKTPEFKIDVGGTTVFMKRLSIATKGCVQLTSN